MYLALPFGRRKIPLFVQVNLKNGAQVLFFPSFLQARCNIIREKNIISNRLKGHDSKLLHINEQFGGTIVLVFTNFKFFIKLYTF